MEKVCLHTKKGDNMIIKREKYLNKLIKYMNNGRVKIITGIRRCGKSFLLRKIFKDYCMSNGILESHFIIIALDDFENNNLLNPLELDKYIRSLIKDNLKYYIILDEIQNVFKIKNPIFTEGKIIKSSKNEEGSISYINIVLGLMQIENIDLYITGSNSRFLSKDIITDFRDRGDEIHVLPLSFSEFYETYEGSKEESYLEYAKYGGFPMIRYLDTQEEKESYLNNLYKLTYSKDVVERNNLLNLDVLDTLTKVIASNIGSLTNSNKISNTFKSEMKKDVGSSKIDSFLSNLEDAYIINKVSRYDIKGRKHIGALYKYYFIDLGLRNSRLDFMHNDKGYIMENIIYNELIYRGFNVEIGVIESFTKDIDKKTIRKIYETDFVAKKGSKVYYIQSCYDISNEDKYEEEEKSLNLIDDSFKKIIITSKNLPVTHDIHGITIIGIIEFLLNENSLDL